MAAFLIAMAVFHSEPVQADAAGKRPWNKWAQAAAIAAVVLINLKGILWIHQEGGALRGYSTALQEPLSRFAPQRDQLYVVWGSAFPFRLFSAFGEFSVFKNMNMVSLAWYQRTPVTRAMLERFGVKDLFPDLVDNPHLFLVCNPWQANAYKVYMIEKHNKMVHLSQAFSSAFFNVFQVRGESPGLDEAINMVK
jgi:hypothetical protein